MKLKKSILIFVLVLALTLSVLTPFAVAQYPSDDDYIFATFINIENNEQWANFTQNIATLGNDIAVNLLANVVDTSTNTFTIPGAVNLTIFGNGNTITFAGGAANTITLNSVNFVGATLVLNNVTVHRATQSGNILQVSNDSQVYLNNGAVVSGILSSAGNASSTAINLLVGRATATINYGYLKNVIRGVTMANSTRLHIYDGEILAENGIHFAGGNNIRAYLNGGIIRRLQTGLVAGTGVHFNANGASHWDYGNSLFIMTDGEITGFREGIGFANNITGNHIRIYIYGGEIHGNHGIMANNPGGGVRLRSQVRFTMTGGAIRDNIANGNGAGLGPQPGGAAASIDLSRIYIGSDAIFFGNQANTLRIADQLALDNAETIRPGQVTYVRHPSGNILNHAFNNHDISVLPAQESIIFPPTPREVLEELVEYVEDMERGNFPATGWTRLISALTAANRVLANEHATEAQIEAALRNLQAMLNALT